MSGTTDGLRCQETGLTSRFTASDQALLTSTSEPMAAVIGWCIPLMDVKM